MEVISIVCYYTNIKQVDLLQRIICFDCTHLKGVALVIGKRLFNMFELLSEKEYKTAESFSVTLGLSNKTIRSLLKELDDILKENGAYIESKNGYGYKLVVSDKTKIEQLKLSNQRKYVPETSEERIQYLLEYLLHSKGYVKSEDLSQMLFVTKKILAHDLKEVEKLMQQYNLTIDRKPYHGSYGV